MSAWEKAIQFTLSREGGYVHDPDDPGGETNFGIAKRYHPDVDIKNLTIEQAREIYKREYWDAIGLDAMPEMIAVAVFDTAVNIGKFKAVQMLQESCNSYNIDEKLNLNLDGVIGPKTIHVVRSINPCMLTRSYLLKRHQYYRLKVVQNPKKRKFFKGWINRTMALSELVLTV
jgi:lysozyme family protein